MTRTDAGLMACTVALLAIACATAPPARAARESVTKLDAVLDRYVKDGRVDYKQLAGDKAARAELHAYLSYVANVDTSGWSRDSQLALWVNAYNMITLERVVEAYPVSSITKIKPTIGVPPGTGVWKEPHRVARGTVTLDAIEHEVLLGRFADPRIHFAINCASRSCPPLASRLYGVGTLDAELDHAARRFINDPRYNRVATGGGTWQLSKIFEWHAGDFAAAAGSVQAFVARYLAAVPAPRATPEPVTIEYLPYDWSLNER